MLNPDKRTADLRGLTKYPRPSCHSISPDPGPAKKGIFSNQPSQRKDLLIVDDDSSITGMLSELLAEWGYEVFHASNGREGLQMFTSHCIDGILLDLEMPVMDGWTMLDELRWRNDDVPVVVMSGGVPAESMRSLLNEGAQGFLIKPFQVEDLQKKCLQIFGRSMRETARVPILIP